MTRGNAAILHHREKGRALRLFSGARGQVRYDGQFEVDQARPSYKADAPQRGSTRTRKVIVFRLRQVDPKPTDLDSKSSPTENAQITEVPVEKQNTELILVHPKAEVYAVTRLEQHLVQAYRKWMESKGVKIVRHRVYPEGEANPLFTDAFDKLRNNLIEAKGSATRESIRMAIGQLADYGRFFQPKPQLVACNIEIESRTCYQLVCLEQRSDCCPPRDRNYKHGYVREFCVRMMCGALA